MNRPGCHWRASTVPQSSRHAGTEKAVSGGCQYLYFQGMVLHAGFHDGRKGLAC